MSNTVTINGITYQKVGSNSGTNQRKTTRRAKRPRRKATVSFHFSSFMYGIATGAVLTGTLILLSQGGGVAL